jgi:hypothetical protein
VVDDQEMKEEAVHMRKRISLLVAALMMALTISFGGAGAAFAKITPAQPPSCENGGGQQPGGQQPNCKGGGLKQNDPTPATNPSGKAPPGQN